MSNKIQTAVQSAPLDLDQLYDPLDDQIDLDPFAIHNPLDAFDGLDKLPVAPTVLQPYVPSANASSLQNMLRSLKSGMQKRVARGEYRSKTDPYEEEKSEIHTAIGTEKYFQPLVLACYFYLNLPTVKKSGGIGHYVQDIIDIMTGEEPVPEELKDSEHPAYAIADDIIEFYPSYWFTDNLAHGTLSRFRKSISEMLEHYPNWDSFSRFQIMGLQSLPRFYDLCDKTRENIFQDAVDLQNPRGWGHFEHNQIKTLERSSMQLTMLEYTMFKDKHSVWFSTENNERVYLQCSNRDHLQFQFFNQMIQASLDIKFEIEDVFISAKEEWTPFRLITGRIVNYENLRLINKETI
jgi:hypothetical protein